MGFFSNFIKKPSTTGEIDCYKGDVYLKVSPKETEFHGTFLYYTQRPYIIHYDPADLESLPKVTDNNPVPATVYLKYAHCLLSTEFIDVITFSLTLDFFQTKGNMIFPLDAAAYIELANDGCMFTLIPKQNVVAIDAQLKSSWIEH